MGRTNPTYRDTLRSLEDSWSDYRRALRRPDQDRFDRLFEQAHQYADAAGYLNYQDPMIVALVSMVLAHETRIEDLEAELEGQRAESPVESRPANDGDSQAR
jgi:hypothetical protein